jgi:putative PIN family toxin of toxin-antitoxin system
MMRVVIDANVYVSALISAKGVPALVVNRWLEGQFDVLVSQPIISEILRVTAYERLQRYKRLRESRLEFVTLLSEQAIWVEPNETVDVVSEDETDNRYVECAVTGGAEYIVSGDPHLLNVSEYRGVRLVSPNDFIALMDSGMV